MGCDAADMKQFEALVTRLEPPPRRRAAALELAKTAAPEDEIARQLRESIDREIMAAFLASFGYELCDELMSQLEIFTRSNPAGHTETMFSYQGRPFMIVKSAPESALKFERVK